MNPDMNPGRAAGGDAIHRVRHSLSHVLAQAVQERFPGATLGFGPAIADGFYYDFVLPEPIGEEDLAGLEATMRRIISKAQPFEYEDLEREAALARLDEMNEPYKREYALELFEERGLEVLRFYKNGDFVDMCEGPHVENTRQLPARGFKLRAVAGAYWRGDAQGVRMTRIYGWAFADRKALKAHEAAWVDAQKRDHKKLGRELELFAHDELVGKGLPLWLPNGTVLRDELEKLAREMEFRAGYKRVSTPILARRALYERTGHLPYYAPHMYPQMVMDEHEAYCLRSMNCPHHHLVFAARKRSYRELPLRLAEYGDVFRYEDSGSLSGLLRVRGMCMNDAHIYCAPEQVKDELRAVMAMYAEAYKVLGLEDWRLRFSTWDPANSAKFVDDPEAWEYCQGVVREVLEESGLPWYEGPGEAAFYGPKIDVQLRSVTGREESASTVQLDFAQPERMDLSYVGSDGREHRPYVIHRAPLSTHERMVAFLIEHYGGAFPTWLAPVQVRVLAVADRHREYAQELIDAMRADFVRAEQDRSGERVGRMVREAAVRKIPNVLVVGDKEVEEGGVTLRRHGVRAQESMPFAAFHERLLAAIRSRSSAL